ncbi:MAG: YgfZ/GcvT domain-containing protein [Gammaproteobacteria bacterium]
MHSEWQSFLADAGASFTEEGISRFGDLGEESQAAISGDCVVDLSHLGLIAVKGAEAAHFLQGQLTNDVQALSETRAQRSAYCNPKGRVVATFLIFSRVGTYFLQLPRPILGSILGRLRLFVMRSDVALTDASDALIGIGVSGWNVHDTLQQAVGPLPKAPNDVSQPAPLTVIRISGERPRYEIIGPFAPIRQLWATLTQVARPSGPHAWSLLDIHCGVPTIHRETADLFVPQMINWDVLSGVSFTKGCYTGQEIVARTQYLGKIKRRLYRAQVNTLDTVIPPATPLIAADEQGSRTIGQVVNAEMRPGGEWDLLVVLATQEAKDATIYLRDEGGPILQLRPLPYSLES